MAAEKRLEQERALGRQVQLTCDRCGKRFNAGYMLQQHLLTLVCLRDGLAGKPGASLPRDKVGLLHLGNAALSSRWFTHVSLSPSPQGMQPSGKARLMSPLHVVDSAIADAASTAPTTTSGWNKVGAAINVAGTVARRLVSGAEDLLELSQQSGDRSGRAARAAVDDAPSPGGEAHDSESDRRHDNAQPRAHHRDHSDDDSDYWPTGSDVDSDSSSWSSEWSYSSGSEDESNSDSPASDHDQPTTTRLRTASTKRPASREVVQSSKGAGKRRKVATSAQTKNTTPDVKLHDSEKGARVWMTLCDVVYLRADATSQVVRYAARNVAGSRVVSNQGAEAVNWSSRAKIRSGKVY
jgi:hypothetical protein